MPNIISETTQGVNIEIRDGVPFRRTGQRAQLQPVCAEYPSCISFKQIDEYCMFHSAAKKQEEMVATDIFTQQTERGEVRLQLRNGVPFRRTAKNIWLKVCKMFPECTKFRKQAEYCHAHYVEMFPAEAAAQKQQSIPSEFKLLAGGMEPPEEAEVIMLNGTELRAYNGSAWRWYDNRWAVVCSEYPACFEVSLQQDGLCRKHGDKMIKRNSTRLIHKANDFATEQAPMQPMDALEHDDADMLMELLGKDADLEHSTHKYKFTMLMKAAESGKAKCLRALVDRKANLETQSTQGSSALLLACRFSHMECVKILVDAKANVSCVNIRGSTPLLRLGSSRNRVEIATLLVDAQADINHRRDDGMNALMLASQYDMYGRLTKFLLEHDADRDVELADGSTAMSLAIGYRNQSAIQALREAEKLEKQRLRKPTPPPGADAADCPSGCVHTISKNGCRASDREFAQVWENERLVRLRGWSNMLTEKDNPHWCDKNGKALTKEEAEHMLLQRCQSQTMEPNDDEGSSDETWCGQWKVDDKVGDADGWLYADSFAGPWTDKSTYMQESAQYGYPNSHVALAYPYQCRSRRWCRCSNFKRLDAKTSSSSSSAAADSTKKPSLKDDTPVAVEETVEGEEMNSSQGSLKRQRPVTSAADVATTTKQRRTV